MGARLVVQKLKFDGSLKYSWPGGEIPGAPAGWVVVHHDPERDTKLPSGPVADDGPPVHLIHYVGLETPLTVIFAFSAAGEFLDAKCDAALPGQWRGDTVSFVDMDLDVVVLPGLQHYIRDQDVFAQRSVSMAYDDEAKRLAHLGILHALRMVRRRQFPFDGHAEALIRELLSGTGGRK